MSNTTEMVTTELLRNLLSKEKDHSISLYMPTHRKYPENLQDVILFKNLIKDLKETLNKSLTEIESRRLIEPIENLSYDIELWNNTLDGLAIFRSMDYFKVVNLQTQLEPLVIISDRFHTKPLRQYIQSIDRFHLLVLNLDRIQLFEGNRYALSEIELNEKIPKTLNASLGDNLTEKYSTVASYGGTEEFSSSMHHGDGGRKDHIENDTEKFFRIIAKAFEENYAKPTGLPLMLAALTEHHHLFHKVNKNPLLLKDGINVNTKHATTKELTQLAWKTLESSYLLQLKEITKKYEDAIGMNNGSDNLEKIAKALNVGKVEVLIVENNRIIPGKIIDAESGTIAVSQNKNDHASDLLDEFALLATKKSSEVVVIPKSEMPTQTGIAAIFRY